MELSLLGIRYLLGLVFLTASLPKLAAPDDFRRALRNYQLLPFRLVRPVATWLLRLELVLALALLAGAATSVTASLAAAALLVFGAAVAINVARGRKIECGCFGGAAPRQITWRLAVRDLLLGLAAIVVAARPPAMWAGHDHAAVFLVALVAVFTEKLVTEWVRLRRALSSGQPVLSQKVAR